LPINVPNILTALRILMVPLFVICLMRELRFFALLVFTFAAISDGLDGLIARYYNQRTALGAYLDPIADKLLLITAFGSLAVLAILPGWLTVIVISRDVLILLGIAIFSITNINLEIRPSLVSKWTTFAQLVTVFMVLLNLTFTGAEIIKYSVFWLTAALTTVSGIHYLYLGLHLLQEANGRSRNAPDEKNPPILP
jgi:cardiolipin synthase (CMP-forming)